MSSNGVITQGNIATIAVERFAQDCKSWAMEHPTISLGIFSGIKGGIGMGRWGGNVTIFDIENAALYRVPRNSSGKVILRIPLTGGHYGPGEPSLGEFLFGSNWAEAAFGGTSHRHTYWETQVLSPEEAEVLFIRLRAQGIKLEDYL